MFKASNMKKLIMSVLMVLATVNVFSNVYSNEGLVNVTHAFDGGLGNITVGKTGNDWTINGTDNSTESALNSALGFIKWISLAGTLLLLGVFIVNLLKLGSSGTNVQARAAAQQGLVWSGISAAVLSIASTVFFFLGSTLSSPPSE